ncbi:hypothetical protein TREES_T100020463 [Tupaia chinensis]|uniref:Uncharacterized protein n=1 Tax=Tupaia chinensis TaxID=246437 RepID=L9KWE1_TUPCH|nr:hypothetical protein TREES_T100020463 [Tupaia chinensis]
MSPAVLSYYDRKAKLVCGYYPSRIKIFPGQGWTFGPYNPLASGTMRSRPARRHRARLSPRAVSRAGDEGPPGAIIPVFVRKAPQVTCPPEKVAAAGLSRRAGECPATEEGQSRTVRVSTVLSERAGGPTPRSSGPDSGAMTDDASRPPIQPAFQSSEEEDWKITIEVFRITLVQPCTVPDTYVGAGLHFQPDSLLLDCFILSPDHHSCLIPRGQWERERPPAFWSELEQTQPKAAKASLLVTPCYAGHPGRTAVVYSFMDPTRYRGTRDCYLRCRNQQLRAWCRWGAAGRGRPQLLQQEPVSQTAMSQSLVEQPRVFVDLVLPESRGLCFVDVSGFTRAPLGQRTPQVAVFVDLVLPESRGLCFVDVSGFTRAPLGQRTPQVAGADRQRAEYLPSLLLQPEKDSSGCHSFAPLNQGPTSAGTAPSGTNSGRHADWWALPQAVTGSREDVPCPPPSGVPIGLPLLRLQHKRADLVRDSETWEKSSPRGHPREQLAHTGPAQLAAVAAACLLPQVLFSAGLQDKPSDFWSTDCVSFLPLWSPSIQPRLGHEPCLHVCSSECHETPRQPQQLGVPRDATAATKHSAHHSFGSSPAFHCPFNKRINSLSIWERGSLHVRVKAPACRTEHTPGAALTTATLPAPITRRPTYNVSVENQTPLLIITATLMREAEWTPACTGMARPGTGFALPGDLSLSPARGFTAVRNTHASPREPSRLAGVDQVPVPGPDTFPGLCVSSLAGQSTGHGAFRNCSSLWMQAV